MRLFEVGEEIRQREIDSLNRVRARRDQDAVKSSLAALRRAALDDTQNLMPPILDAARNYASVGEICSVLRDVFGEYEEPDQS